jgi:hypothetical protein
MDAAAAHAALLAYQSRRADAAALPAVSAARADAYNEAIARGMDGASIAAAVEAAHDAAYAAYIAALPAMDARHMYADARRASKYTTPAVAMGAPYTMPALPAIDTAAIDTAALDALQTAHTRAAALLDALPMDARAALQTLYTAALEADTPAALAAARAYANGADALQTMGADALRKAARTALDSITLTGHYTVGESAPAAWRALIDAMPAVSAALDARRAALDAWRKRPMGQERTAPTPAPVDDAAADTAARADIAAINALPAAERAALLDARRADALKAPAAIDAARARDILLTHSTIRAAGMPGAAADTAADAAAYRALMPWYIGPIAPPAAPYAAARAAHAYAHDTAAHARTALLTAQATPTPAAIDAARIAYALARHARADAARADAILHRAITAAVQIKEDIGTLYAAARIARKCIWTILKRTGKGTVTAHDAAADYTAAADAAAALQAGGGASVGYNQLYTALYRSIMPAWYAMIAPVCGATRGNNDILPDAADLIAAAAGELFALQKQGHALPSSIVRYTDKGAPVTAATLAARAVHRYMYGRRTTRNTRKNAKGDAVGVSIYTTDTMEYVPGYTLARIQPDASAALLWDDIRTACKAAGISASGLDILAAHVRGERDIDIAARMGITRGRVSQRMADCRAAIKAAGLDVPTPPATLAANAARHTSDD